MNTERTPHPAEEDDESDDSSVVSFGSGGPAFRPIPRIRIERPTLVPPPEKARRLPEGLLFDRVLDAERISKSATKTEEEDSEEATRDHGPDLPVEPKPYHNTHLPDIGEFTSTIPPDISLPEQPPEPAHPSHASTPGFDGSPPLETVLNTPEQPEDTPSQLPSHNFIPATHYETPPVVAAESYNDSEEENTVPQIVSATSMGNGGSTGTGSAGGHPPVPPPGSIPSTPNFGSQPPSNHNAAYYGGSGGGGYNPNASPTPFSSSPEAPSPVSVHNKKGNIWPYVAVLGENIARKRADRKLKKELGSRIEAQGSIQEQAAANQLRLEKRQQEMLHEQRRQAVATPRRVGEWGVPSAVHGPAESQGSGFRQTSERPLVSGQEAGRPIANPNQGRSMPEGIEEPIPLQPHQKVEHSAWHTIVVNEKGQEVTGAVQYGEGFKRERQQEIIRDHTGDSVVAGAAGGNGGAGAGNSSGGGQYGAGPSYSHTLPSGMTTPGLTAGSPTHVDPQHQLSPHMPKKPGIGLPGPLFWLMVSLILAAFFAAALI